MGKGQGRKRLQDGIIRSLTPHELSRGYVFITYDKSVNKILNPDDFNVEVGDKTFEHKRLDVSGRVHIPRPYLLPLAQNKVMIKVNSKTLSIKPSDG